MPVICITISYSLSWLKTRSDLAGWRMRAALSGPQVQPPPFLLTGCFFFCVLFLFAWSSGSYKFLSVQILLLSLELLSYN